MSCNLSDSCGSFRAIARGSTPCYHHACFANEQIKCSGRLRLIHGNMATCYHMATSETRQPCPRVHPLKHSHMIQPEEGDTIYYQKDSQKRFFSAKCSAKIWLSHVNPPMLLINPKEDKILTITMSRLKVKMSGRVLVRSSASETPLKRSTFLFTLNVSVIFSCFSFDFVDLPDFLVSAGFGGSTGVFGSVVLGFLLLPFGGVSETQ